eukprot:CAMPEP_0198130610 /NCGR_PEP_ID=MMETSP1442-20131203/54366_1 /TAXON_ID= /ORGANISM="Craspedostauros australis, Strain CCMP3328" /LENGTH=326 /DNA_ID=CAMNT_0043791275 /DNA_START=29 /DNA_END=1010 /DNA_ORIENTATION=+
MPPFDGPASFMISPRDVTLIGMTGRQEPQNDMDGCDRRGSDSSNNSNHTTITNTNNSPRKKSLKPSSSSLSSSSSTTAASPQQGHQHTSTTPQCWEHDGDCESLTTATSTAVSTATGTSTAAHVRFLETTDIFESDLPRASELSDDDKAGVWWTEADYRAFDKNIEALVKSMQCRPESVSGTGLSYGQVIQRVYDACVEATSQGLFEIPSEDQEMLVRWMKRSHNRRGLESFLVETLAIDQQVTQEKTLESVRRMYESRDVYAATKALAIQKGARSYLKHPGFLLTAWPLATWSPTKWSQQSQEATPQEGSATAGKNHGLLCSALL